MNSLPKKHKHIGNFILFEIITEKPTSIFYRSIDERDDNLYLAKCIPKQYINKENGEANLKNELLKFSNFHIKIS